MIEHSNSITSGGDHALDMDSVHVRQTQGLHISAPIELHHSMLDTVGTSSQPALRLYADALNDTLRVSNTVIRGAPNAGLSTDYMHSEDPLYRWTQIKNSEITGSGGTGWDYHGGARDSLNIYDNAGDGVVVTLNNPSSSTGTFTWGSTDWWGDTAGPDGTNGDGVSITNSGWTVDVTDWLTAPMTITGPWVPWRPSDH